MCDQKATQLCQFHTSIFETNGWATHFRNLATPSTLEAFDDEYLEQSSRDILAIQQLCNHHQFPDSVIINTEVVSTALHRLNKGKAHDVYNLAVEHLVYGGEELLDILTFIVTQVFRLGSIPDSLKLGILTPIYMKKRDKHLATSYRGITVTPVISKVIECILRDYLRIITGPTQNPLQRDFTAKVSPMNCALILQEAVISAKCSNRPIYIAFLDAKSAFDVVSHTILARQTYIRGVSGILWTLLSDINIQASSVVTWEGSRSRPFQIQQGVRQGGVVSTESYKIYVDTLLDILRDNQVGKVLGDIYIGSPTCADDIALVADSPYELQLMINIAVDFSKRERYNLRPIKSVILEILPNYYDESIRGIHSWDMDGNVMPNVLKTTHLGIVRSVSEQTTTSIQENITNSRKSAYSLMGAGLHGVNGLDPATACKLTQLYILPTLVYGMEILLPTRNELVPLERFFRKFLKQLLSLPNSTADSAVYVITGFLTAEVEIHKRALALFGNICRAKDSLENQLACRQLSLPSASKYSWLRKIKALLAIYNLGSPFDLLENIPNKEEWRRKVRRSINSYWKNHILTGSDLSSSLKFLHVENYHPGKPHRIIQSVNSANRDIDRVFVKLKLATGTYMLQSNRAAFNQNVVNPTCLLCKQEPETAEHFLIRCPFLQQVRKDILPDFLELLHELKVGDLQISNESKLTKLITDSSCLVNEDENTMDVTVLD